MAKAFSELNVEKLKSARVESVEELEDLLLPVSNALSSFLCQWTFFQESLMKQDGQMMVASPLSTNMRSYVWRQTKKMGLTRQEDIVDNLEQDLSARKARLRTSGKPQGSMEVSALSKLDKQAMIALHEDIKPQKKPAQSVSEALIRAKLRP
eukprot:750774-Hanusia_phi.AAC.1